MIELGWVVGTTCLCECVGFSDVSVVLDEVLEALSELCKVGIALVVGG